VDSESNKRNDETRGVDGGIGDPRRIVQSLPAINIPLEQRNRLILIFCASYSFLEASFEYFHVLKACQSNDHNQYVTQPIRVDEFHIESILRHAFKFLM